MADVDLRAIHTYLCVSLLLCLTHTDRMNERVAWLFGCIPINFAT